MIPEGRQGKLCKANVHIYYSVCYEAGRLICKNVPRDKKCPQGLSAEVPVILSGINVPAGRLRGPFLWRNIT